MLTGALAGVGADVGACGVLEVPELPELELPELELPELELELEPDPDEELPLEWCGWLAGLDLAGEVFAGEVEAGWLAGLGFAEEDD